MSIRTIYREVPVVDAASYSKAAAGEREGLLSDLKIRERYRTIFELYDKMIQQQERLLEAGEE